MVYCGLLFYCGLLWFTVVYCFTVVFSSSLSFLSLSSSSLFPLPKVDLKILVGLFGVGMVLVAVLAALGLLSYIGIMGSLIIIEVVPFLVLAVGVDNLFILVHSYEVTCCSLTSSPCLSISLRLLPISPLPYSSILFPLLRPPFSSPVS